MHVLLAMQHFWSSAIKDTKQKRHCKLNCISSESPTIVRMVKASSVYLNCIVKIATTVTPLNNLAGMAVNIRSIAYLTCCIVVAESSMNSN